MALGDVLDYIGGSLAKPGRAVRGLMTGNPREALNVVPFSDTMGLTDPHQAVSGRDLLDRYGLTHHGDEGWGAWGAGVAADLATDPLSYLPAHWLGKAFKFGRGAEAAGGLAREATAARRVRGLGDAIEGYGLAGDEAAQLARQKFRAPGAPEVMQPTGGAQARYRMKPGPAPQTRPFSPLPHEIGPPADETLEAWHARQAGARPALAPEVPEQPIEAWHRQVRREMPPPPPSARPPEPPPSGPYEPPSIRAFNAQDPAQLMYLGGHASDVEHIGDLMGRHALAGVAPPLPAPAQAAPSPGLFARLRSMFSGAPALPEGLAEGTASFGLPGSGTAALRAAGIGEGPGLSTALRGMREGIPTVKGIGGPRMRMLAHEGADIPALARFARRVEGSGVHGLSMPPWAAAEEGAGAAFIRHPQATREELLHAMTQRAAHAGDTSGLPLLARPAANMYRAANATGSESLTGLAQVLDELSAKTMAGRGLAGKLGAGAQFLYSPAAHAAYGPQFGRFGLLPRAAYHGVPLATLSAPAFAAGMLAPGLED